MMSFWRTAILLTLAISPVWAQGTSPTAQGTPVLAEFDQRIKTYTDLRANLNKGAGKVNETSKPEEIAAARQAIAAKIVSARAGAKPGDIFTPAVQNHIRIILVREMKGVKGQNARGSIWDEGPGPGAFKLTINSTYPKNQPLGSVPPSILEKLPTLPEGLEYRFVYRHLLLRDAQANLILDFMPAALPAA